MLYFTIAFLLIIFLISKWILIVPMREVQVVERLGKFKAILQPGFHFLVPFIDRVAYRHDTRELVLDVPPQSCITKDNIQVEVDGLVYLKVLDGQKASYGIEDYKVASVNLAQTTMRSEIGKLNLSQIFSERESLNTSIVREIDPASDPWGIKVLRYEIRNITPSAHVIHTLEKQMEAERRKRAEITLASAEREAKINLSQGDKQEAINISEGHKQKQINEAKGKAREIEIIAHAKADGMRLVADAIAQQGGKDAMNMQLMEHYLENVNLVLEEAQVTMMPKDMAAISGLIAGMQTQVKGE